MNETVNFGEYVTSFKTNDVFFRCFHTVDQIPETYAIEYLVFRDEEEAEYWQRQFKIDAAYACVNNGYMNALILHRPIGRRSCN